MSIFRVDTEIAPPSGRPDVFIPAGRLLVDSGSELSWIRRETLIDASVTAVANMRFVMANGQEIVRETGYAVLRAQGFQTIDVVVFAEEGDMSIVGVRTLEGFNAVVDPVRRCLVAGGPIITATAA